jgi:diguanylate cyclase (GGDEF)-like protein
MKLMARPVILTGAALAGIFLFLCISSKAILLDSYARLEEEYTGENVRRALSTINDNLAQLNTVVGDYSGWDEAYRFVNDGNAAFIKTNLNDNIFPKLRLNLLAYVGNSGKIIYAKGYDLSRERVAPFPEGLLKHLTVSGPLLRHETIESATTGVLLLPEGILLVASRPVLTSEYKGPVNGTLIMGRFLDAAETRRLADISHLSLKFYRFDDPVATPDVRTIRPLLSRGPSIRIRQRNGETISGYALIDDIYNAPAVIAKIDMQRKIYKQGLKTVVYYIAWIMGGCIIFALISHFLYAKLIMANHDPLTGLPNRTLFLDRLRQALAKKELSGKMLAVVFLDLDQFKFINNSLGHHVGDLLLKEVAARLNGCLRSTDTVSRLGGDEFTMILDDMAMLEDSVLVADKIFSAFATPFRLEDHEVFVTPSVGISLYPADGKTAEELLRNADTAMFHAKEKGRNNYQFFAEELNARMSERLSLKTGLRRALQRDEFLLHYQPRIDLATGRVACAEALIRWQHPEKGLISPATFIPLAEETGLITPIGEWVLRTACAQNKSWQVVGLPPMRVSVNVSVRQFTQQNIADVIRDILAETGLGPEFLELEITESVIMVNPDKAIRTLDELKGMGISIAIDDFGTGYSSLMNLKRFPVDMIKIDRSFISGIAVEKRDETLVSTIISMGHNLGLGVVAEGVETDEQLTFLAERGCQEVQGFYLSEPLPPASLNMHLEKGTLIREESPNNVDKLFICQNL